MENILKHIFLRQQLPFQPLEELSVTNACFPESWLHKKNPLCVGQTDGVFEAATEEFYVAEFIE
jgi:hypothetical protein